MADKTWGIRFNHQQSYERIKKGTIPAGAPEWLALNQTDLWQKQGVIVWNDSEKRIACLSGNEASVLLEEMKTSDTWKSEGISVKRQIYRIEIPLVRKGKYNKGNQELENESPKSKSERVHEELVHLPPEASAELLEVLQIKEQSILEMAKQEKSDREQAIRNFFDCLYKFERKTEQANFDFDGRSFEWKSVEKNRWTCRYQIESGHICLDKSMLYWHACVKILGKIEKSGYFPGLSQSVDWVEKELIDLVNMPAKPETKPRIHSELQIKTDQDRLRLKLKGSSYWINPTELEPERITYQVIIELEAYPINFKTYESICGEIHRYDERYPTPLKLSTSIGLDFDHFTFDQPIGENSELYRINSLTTFYQENLASEKAQNTWDQSQILQQFKAGKIKRAYYGYQEVETGFQVILGTCSNPENPWRQPISRDEQLESMAFRESLCFALDVNDYRDFLGVSSEMISDERLFMFMHKTRAKSKYVPDDSKLESRIWLAQNEES